MLHYKILKDENGNDVYEIDSDGYELLHNPILNKGTAFLEKERKLFKIDGFLPSTVASLEEQIERSYENYRQKPTDLEKFIFLRSLQDRNETLYYAFLQKHLEEMVPIVYTPTVGLACQTYSHIFRFTRGIFLSLKNIDRADQVFESLPYRNIEMIVVTDSEGILGLGDQGAGGMGIPIGKLSLYTAGAGIHPANCLPITLDVGTNNEKLLNDPLYLGVRQRRLRGEQYFNFIERFVNAIKRNFPGAILQWEDFSKQNAFTLLDRYKNSHPSFNDDIQGTGAVVLAGIIGAMKIKREKLIDQIFIIYGAGAGGIGVTRQIFSSLKSEGLSEEKALERIYVIDSRGVICEGRTGVDDYKKQFSRKADFAKEWTLRDANKVTLHDTIKNAKPTILLGLSGRPGDFKKEIVLEMLKNCKMPVICPLSNPSTSSEAKPEDILRWTEGSVIISTGSPFPDIDYNGKIFKIGQGNNAFIFPGLGLGALVVKAKKITSGMFNVAAKKLSELVPEARLNLHCVYPAMSELRSVSEQIAITVAHQAIEEKVAGNPVSPEILSLAVTSKMWKPKYTPFTRCIDASE